MAAGRTRLADKMAANPIQRSEGSPTASVYLDTVHITHHIIQVTLMKLATRFSLSLILQFNSQVEKLSGGNLIFTAKDFKMHTVCCHGLGHLTA